jgi:hypothetical protein
VPNVGLMGSTMFEGCSLQQVLQFKSMNYPNPQRLIKCQKVYTRFTNYQYTSNEYKINIHTRYTKDTMISHPLASNHKSTQGSDKWCLPKWDTQSLIDPHHNNDNWLTRYSNDNKPMYHNTIKDKASSCIKRYIK